MIHVEPDKLVISIKTPFPCTAWTEIMFALVRAISIMDKDRIDNDSDCTFGLCQLLEEMLPGEADMEKILQKK